MASFYISRRPPEQASANQTVSPPVATASASALVPVPQLKVSPAAATASASAPVPSVDVKVSPAAATASASAPLPAVQLNVSPAAATASASGPLPAVQLKVSPAAATASASSFVPVPQLRVIVPTKGPIVLGYSNQLLTGTQAQDAERLIGRTFRGLRQNQNINTTGWSTAVTEYALGRKLTYRSMDTPSGSTWADVKNGLLDTNILAVASNLAATGLWSPSNPAYICFHHEATISSNSVFGVGQDYIDAYRHVVDLWDANGYTVTKKDGTPNGGPIVMVLVHFQRAFTNTLELGGTETPPAGLAHADFDPDGGSSPAPGGTTYYSGIGIDAYNSITSAGHLKYGTTASNLLDGVFTQAHNTGKFTFIGEFGCEDGTTTTDHQNKSDWLDSCRTYFSSKIGAVEQTRAVLLTIKSSVENYNVDSSQQATDAFRRWGLHSDFYPEYATGFGFNSTLPISVPVATSSASALVPQIQLSIAVPAATASASAPVPVPQLKVLPPAATASASAPAPVEPLVVPLATASANGPPPVPQLAVLVPAATASASAPIPTVTTSGAGNQTVSPPAATASASAPVPVPQLGLTPAAATASASAPVPTVQVKISLAAATASASAPLPGVGISVLPPAATASASALVPVPQLRLTPPVATSNAPAPVPGVDVKVSPPAATASATAPVPVPQLRVLPPAATAAASSPVPTLQDRLTPPAATANASAPTPTIQVRVIVPAATASASAPIPTISGVVDQLVLPPVATASASAPVPSVTAKSTISAPTAFALAMAPIPAVIQKQWPPDSGLQWPEHDYTRWPARSSQRWVSIPVAQWPPDTHEQW